MKKIGALIDFTPTSDIVVEYSTMLAKSMNLEVEFIHVAEDSDIDVKKNQTEILDNYVSFVESKGQKARHAIHYGSFFRVITSILKESHIDLVIIGTHGKKGIMQNLFGSHILKLVQMTKLPSLVIQENTVIPKDGINKILCPVSSHDNFNVQLQQCTELLSPNGQLDIYAIHKTSQLDENSQANINSAKDFMELNGINYSIKEEDASFYSVGYSKQTLEFLKNNSYNMISIMSQISEASKYFGEMDKENIILNPMGVPVLCCDA